MRLPFWRAALSCGVSPYALTLRMAGGFNKRAVIWCRRYATETDGAKTITVHPETTDAA